MKDFHEPVLGPYMYGLKHTSQVVLLRDFKAKLEKKIIMEYTISKLVYET